MNTVLLIYPSSHDIGVAAHTSERERFDKFDKSNAIALDLLVKV